jgi:hypothetical protein
MQIENDSCPTCLLSVNVLKLLNVVAGLISQTYVFAKQKERKK